MPEIFTIGLAALVGFTAGMLYKWFQIMFSNGYLAYRELIKQWVKIIPRNASREDIENISTMIKRYFQKK